jgi:hypothetical protein
MTALVLRVRPGPRALVLALLATLLPPAAPRAGAAGAGGSRGWCAKAPGPPGDAVWGHREATLRRGPMALAARDSSYAAGQIAVLFDENDLALRKNVLDLSGEGLTFTPASGGYSVTRVDRPLAADTGTTLTLTDDDSRAVTLPFPFSFYGHSYTKAFVNSDGNLTFGEGDDASTARRIGRLVNGPPRIAPLLADLDPSSIGHVSTRDEGDRFTVTWTGVPQFEEGDRNTFQVALWPDGRIDFGYGQDLTGALKDGVVGIAPGHGQGGITPVDFSTAVGVSGTGPLAESFRNEDILDTVAVARKFYRSFGDDYEQLVVFTNRHLVSAGTFAYEQTVKNHDAGIGVGSFDQANEYGSAGRLESFVMMDDLGKYPANLNQRFLGADTALSVLAHEVGHRWLAHALFKDGGQSSHDLLGRDDVHWSFFMDSEGSFLEGNQIQDLGGGQFRTSAASVRYSPLDQYLMGLRAAAEVPLFFYVAKPTGTTDTSKGRDPQVGVTFQGSRKDVAVGDVVAALGPRIPAVGGARATMRLAFVFVAVGAPPTDAELAKMEALREAFIPFYATGTDGRGRVDPRLH